MKQQKLLAVILVAATFNVYANSDNKPLEILVVTGTRIEQPLKQSLSHTTVITRKDIEASQATDAASVLKNLAGIEFSQSGGTGKQSSMFVRGTNSSHVLVLVDGVRVNSATTGATAIDQIMLDQVDHIEVVRGNVSSLYGSDAIGGVIQIFTRQSKGEPTFNISGGAGTHNTRRAAAGVSGALANTSFSLQASKFKSDSVSAINVGIVPTVNPDADGYDNTSISGNVRHTFDESNSLSASVFQSRGDVQFDSAFGASTDQNSTRSVLGKLAVLSENRLSEVWQSKLEWSQGVDDSKSYLNGGQSSGIKTTNRQIGWQSTISTGASGSLLLGLENLDQRVDSTIAYTQDSRRIKSLFAGYSGNIGQHQFQANFRQDRYSDFGTANTWRLNVGHAFGEAWRASIGISTAFKAPTFNDMYGPPGWGSNPDLNPERSRNGEVGLNYKSKGQTIDVVYFDSRVNDLIAADSSWTLQNLSAVRINGVEISYAGQFGDTGVNAALTKQQPRDIQTGEVLLRRADIFSSMGVTQQFGEWKLGGEWQYSGKREDSDINTFARATLPGYSVANLTASHDISKQLKLSLRVDNLFNKDYMLAHGYNTLRRTLFVGFNYQP